MNSRGFGTAVLMLACAIMLASAAHAGSKKREAKKHFSQAQVHFKLGRFDQALTQYSKAYELLPLPAFLFNIGQCHRNMENYKRAIHFYQGFLRERPRAKNREVVKDLIALSQEKLQAQEQELERQRELARKKLDERRQQDAKARAEQEKLRQEKDKRTSKEFRLALEQTKKEAADRAAELIAKSRQEQAEAELRRQEELESSRFYKQWWFWTIVGGVVVGAAAGGTAYALSGQETTVLPSGSMGTFDRRGL